MGVMVACGAALFTRKRSWWGRLRVSWQFLRPALCPADQYLCSRCGWQRAAHQPLVWPTRWLSHLHCHLEPPIPLVSSSSIILPCCSNKLCLATGNNHSQICQFFFLLLGLGGFQMMCSQDLPLKYNKKEILSWLINDKLRWRVKTHCSYCVW